MAPNSAKNQTQREQTIPGGETRGGYGPAYVVRNPSCAGPTTRRIGGRLKLEAWHKEQGGGSIAGSTINRWVLPEQGGRPRRNLEKTTGANRVWSEGSL